MLQISNKQTRKPPNTAGEMAETLRNRMDGHGRVGSTGLPGWTDSLRYLLKNTTVEVPNLTPSLQ